MLHYGRWVYEGKERKEDQVVLYPSQGGEDRLYAFDRCHLSSPLWRCQSREAVPPGQARV
jgi:hypothetical protein